MTKVSHHSRNFRILSNFCVLLNMSQYNLISNANRRILDLVMSQLNCRVEAGGDVMVSEDCHHPALWIRALEAIKSKPSGIHSFLPFLITLGIPTFHSFINVSLN